jgi:hypothetical protein
MIFCTKLKAHRLDDIFISYLLLRKRTLIKVAGYTMQFLIWRLGWRALAELADRLQKANQRVLKFYQ